MPPNLRDVIGSNAHLLLHPEPAQASPGPLALQVPLGISLTGFGQDLPVGRVWVESRVRRPRPSLAPLSSPALVPGPWPAQGAQQGHRERVPGPPRANSSPHFPGSGSRGASPPHLQGGSLRCGRGQTGCRERDHKCGAQEMGLGQHSCPAQPWPHRILDSESCLPNCKDIPWWGSSVCQPRGGVLPPSLIPKALTHPTHSHQTGTPCPDGPGASPSTGGSSR